MPASRSPSSAQTPASSTSASAPASSHSDGGEEESAAATNSPRRACEKCTRSKRKCDKTSPVCGRCKRLGAKCNYNYGPSPRSRSIESIRPRDHPRFIREGGTIASLLAAVDSFGEPHSPTVVQLLTGSSINWRETYDVHFHAVHRWFSIFNREKIETIFGSTLRSNVVDETPFEELQVPSADVALLLVCVYLSSQYVGPYRAGSQIEHPLYKAVKRTFALLRCLMQPTVELMQCGALICLVEYGHGVFVTAHETLAETAAMARIFDLRPGKYVEEGALKPWPTEEEEACTLWWCLFELEQLIHQDPFAKHLPFIMPAPEPDDLLPPDVENANGSRPLPLRLPQSTPAYILVENRRRSAQSAVVLHRALLWEARYSYRDGDGIVHPLIPTTVGPSLNFSSMDIDMPIDPSLQPPPTLSTGPLLDNKRTQEQDLLDASTRALLAAMVNQTNNWELFCDCFSMCLSALYILHLPSLPSIESSLRYLPPSQLAQLLAPSPSQLHNIPHPTNPDPTTPPSLQAVPIPFPPTAHRALAALNFAARFVSDFAYEFNKGVKSDPRRLAETVVAPAIQTIGISLEVFLRLGDVLPDARDRFESIWEGACWFTTRWGSGDVVLSRVVNVKRRRGGIVVPPLPDAEEWQGRVEELRRSRRMMMGMYGR
ncbi:hypothetical protein GE09DRAFT_1216436 [Coniochaeta sp. 2T2.1]|nr:hypothetical protein GE09DRAFT_1216436 [Coniochaeta sp. 2T2.1]